jgi:5-methylcytosine-specific restriction protein A
MAKRIRELLTAADPDSTELPDLDPVDLPAAEGGVALRAHLRRERDPKLRRRKLDHTKRRGLPIACEACRFDFGQTYGPMVWATSNATTAPRFMSQVRP